METAQDFAIAKLGMTLDSKELPTNDPPVIKPSSPVVPRIVSRHN